MKSWLGEAFVKDMILRKGDRLTPKISLISGRQKYTSEALMHASIFLCLLFSCPLLYYESISLNHPCLLIVHYYTPRRRRLHWRSFWSNATSLSHQTRSVRRFHDPSLSLVRLLSRLDSWPWVWYGPHVSRVPCLCRAFTGKTNEKCREIGRIPYQYFEKTGVQGWVCRVAWSAVCRDCEGQRGYRAIRRWRRRVLFSICWMSEWGWWWSTANTTTSINTNINTHTTITFLDLFLSIIFDVKKTMHLSPHPYYFFPWFEWIIIVTVILFIFKTFIICENK